MRCAIASPPSAIISKKLEGFSEKPGKEREFRNARAFANPFPGTLRRHALGVVRGDEPDCPGKRNLLTALIGLQRAADRRGNRGTRFRTLVLQGAACGSERHRGLEGLFDPASTGNVEIEVAHTGQPAKRIDG